MCLSDLKTGDIAVITEVYERGEEWARIAKIGLTVGAKIRVVGVSPLRSAVAVRCGNFTVAIPYGAARVIGVKYAK